MGMSAGKLDRRITIMRKERTPDGAGGTTIELVPIGTIWANRSDIKDGEKYAAGLTSSDLTSRFTVRSSAFSRGITPIDEIKHAGLLFNVTGTKESAEGRLNYIELTATARTTG